MPFSRRVFIGSSLATIVGTPAYASSPKADWTILEARKASLRLKPAPAGETALWTYNGRLPGPLLRYTKGEEVRVRLVNKLDQPTSLCWHGVRIDNAMDGVAGLTQPAVAPGASFDYRFTPKDSGLYFYHPHVHPFSAEQQGRGLFGALIVDEDHPPDVDQDLMVVIADWTLDEDGALQTNFADPAAAMRAGLIGQTLSIGMQAAPVTQSAAPGARLRLRIVSAVSARLMIMSFVGVKPLVMAIDGQPCDAFEPVRRTLPIGPGARFDVMLDLPADGDSEARIVLRGEGEPDRPLMLFKRDGEKRPARAPIASLPANPLLPAVIRLERSLKLDLVLDGGAKTKDAPVPADPTKLWTLNGIASDGVGGRPLFTVKRGTPVTLGFVNKTAFVQQMRVHGHHLRLLHDLDDGWEPYWRDAILIPEGRTKHVAFVADNPGKWAIESLMLQRQVTGLAGWFEVT